MSISIKDTEKRNITIKNLSIENGDIVINGTILDLTSVLEKAYPNQASFDITISAKKESEMSLEQLLESSDEDDEDC